MKKEHQIKLHKALKALKGKKVETPWGRVRITKVTRNGVTVVPLDGKEKDMDFSDFNEDALKDMGVTVNEPKSNVGNKGV